MRPAVVALSLAVVTLLAPATAGARFAITKCGRVAYAGEKVPVYAHKYPCDKAKRIARNWLRTDEPPSGWRVGNLGGCEWQFAPRSGSLSRWRVDVVRLQGCQD